MSFRKWNGNDCYYGSEDNAIAADAGASEREFISRNGFLNLEAVAAAVTVLLSAAKYGFEVIPGVPELLSRWILLFGLL